MTAPAMRVPTPRQIRFARISLLAYAKLREEPPADIKAIAETPLPSEDESGSG